MARDFSLQLVEMPQTTFADRSPGSLITVSIRRARPSLRYA